MTSLDEQYKRMGNRCEQYHDKIDALRDQLYGYTVSLEHITLYGGNFVLTAQSGTRGINKFCNKIIKYCKGLSSDASPCFSEAITEADEAYIRALLIAIIYFLKSRCTKSEYTFNSVMKLLKSFLGEVSEENVNNLRASVFWIIYSDHIEHRMPTLPKVVQEAYTAIFADFNYNYSKRMADCARHAVRFYLYDNKMDFIGDDLLFAAMLDMLDEVQDRLRNIADNRRPRINVDEE